MYYRQSDIVQTGDISSESYLQKTVSEFDPAVTQFTRVLSGLLPYTNYTVHVQAVILGLFGVIEREILQITQSLPAESKK